MPNRYQRRTKSLFILCLIVGLTSLIYLPVTKLDTLPIRGEITVLEKQYINSYRSSEPYKAPSYLVCSIDDDLENYNNHGIYHPVDLAVTISNLKRLGTKHLFLGTHLHWPGSDAQDNGTLNSAISELDSCIISVPLRRTAGSVNIPDYLLTTSVAVESVDGNLKLLPQVNNLGLAPTFTIPDNTQAGFSQLETELNTRKIPLIAIWGKRIILSSLLLERMHHLKVKPIDLKINLGTHIMLGKSGNIIPIDEFGYFSPTNFPAEVKPDIISASITSVEESPVDSPNTILTAAGIRADSFRAIDQPVTQLEQLTLTPVIAIKKTYQRVYFLYHLAALLFIIYLLIKASALRGKKHFLILILLSILTLGVSLIVAQHTPYFLVTTHLIIVVIVASIYQNLVVKRRSQHRKSTVDYITAEEISDSFTTNKVSINRQETT